MSEENNNAVLDENPLNLPSRLTMLDITDINPSEYNTYPIEGIQELAANIELCGLMTPLTVIGPLKDNKYEILAGERRWRALASLVADGKEEFRQVPVLIREGITNKALYQKFLIECENVMRRDMTQQDIHKHRMNFIKILSELLGEDDEHIARKAANFMSMSPRYAQMYLQIINAGPQVQELVEQGKLGISQASRIMGLDEDEREDAFSRIEEGEKASNILSEHKAKKQEKLDEMLEDEVPATHSGHQISDVAKQVLRGEDADREEIQNRFNELASQYTSSNDTSAYDSISGYTNYNADTKVKDEDKATMVIKWCEQMLQRDEYEPYEEEAIDVCRRLVEYYDSLN